MPRIQSHTHVYTHTRARTHSASTTAMPCGGTVPTTANPCASRRVLSCRRAAHQTVSSIQCAHIHTRAHLQVDEDVGTEVDGAVVRRRAVGVAPVLRARTALASPRAHTSTSQPTDTPVGWHPSRMRRHHEHYPTPQERSQRCAVTRPAGNTPAAEPTTSTSTSVFPPSTHPRPARRDSQTVFDRYAGASSRPDTSGACTPIRSTWTTKRRSSLRSTR